MFFFFFSPETGIYISIGGDLHELSNTVFQDNNKKHIVSLLSVESDQRVIKVKLSLAMRLTS